MRTIFYSDFLFFDIIFAMLHYYLMSFFYSNFSCPTSVFLKSIPQSRKSQLFHLLLITIRYPSIYRLITAYPTKILPFTLIPILDVPLHAQREMVETFMEGIDPFYRGWIESYLSKLFGEYHEIIGESIPQLSNNQKGSLIKKLRKAGNTILVSIRKPQIFDASGNLYTSDTIRKRFFKFDWV